MANLGTALTDPVGMVADTSYLIEVAVNGDLATLKVNGTVMDENRNIGGLGSVYNNAMADHVMLGSNALGTGQRRTIVSIDDLVVSQGSTPTFAAADFDELGTVDKPDLTRLQTNFGKAIGALHTEGDSDTDNDVDGNDFLKWQSQLGQVGPVVAAAATVPEPGALALAGLAALFAVRRRK